MKHTVSVATVADHPTEADARRVLGTNGQMPYLGTWTMPYGGHVHVFSHVTAAQLVTRGWTPRAREGS